MAILKDAKWEAESGERVSAFGPFVIGNSRYDIVAYFQTRRYWWTLIRSFPTAMSSFFIPSAYLRGRNVDELVLGVRVYDSKSRAVPYNKELYRQAFRAVRIWIRVYLNPFYPPRPKYFQARLALIRRVAKLSEKRGVVEETFPSKDYYIEQIEKADRSMMAYMDTFEKHNKILENVNASLRQVSDNPSAVGMEELRRRAERFKTVLNEMALQCEARAKSWPDAEAARAAIEQIQGSRGNPWRKLAPRALIDGIIGAVFGILSGGSLAVGFAFSVASEMGLSYLRRFVLGPQRQVRNLLRAASGYNESVTRVDDFIAIYSAEPSRDNFRV